MATVQVLGPDEVVARWQQALPDAVIETFNELLIQKFNGQSAIIYQDDLMKVLVNKGLKAQDVYDQRWLDQAEQCFKDQGWKVTYSSPDWDESFRSHFHFTLK